MVPLFPKQLTSGNRAKGRFDKRDFRYLPEIDEFQCPAGERAIQRCSTLEKGLLFYNTGRHLVTSEYWHPSRHRLAMSSPPPFSI